MGANKGEENRNQLKKILFVDDDQSIHDLVEVALKKLDTLSDIKYVTSGRMALKIVEKFKPDLIIFDVIMPEMDGVEVLGSLKKNQNTKNIPVVFLTAKHTEFKIKALINFGGSGVISKPFNVATFASTLQEIWMKTHG